MRRAASSGSDSAIRRSACARRPVRMPSARFCQTDGDLAGQPGCPRERVNRLTPPCCLWPARRPLAQRGRPQHPLLGDARRSAWCCWSRSTWRAARRRHALPLGPRDASRGGWSYGGPRRSGPPGCSPRSSLVTFVLGVIKTDNAKKVEASGPNGLQATRPLLTAQRVTLPSHRHPDGAAADQDLRAAVDLALRVSGRDVLVLRARRPGRHRRRAQALLDRRRPPLVRAGPERQVRRDARATSNQDLVQGGPDGRLRRRQLRLLRALRTR